MTTNTIRTASSVLSLAITAGLLSATVAQAGATQNPFNNVQPLPQGENGNGDAPPAPPAAKKPVPPPQAVPQVLPQPAPKPVPEAVAPKTAPPKVPAVINRPAEPQPDTQRSREAQPQPLPDNGPFNRKPKSANPFAEGAPGNRSYEGDTPRRPQPVPTLDNPAVRDRTRPVQPPQTAGVPRNLDDIKRERVRRVEGNGNRVVIEEPDKRVIVKQNDRMVIQRDENFRVRQVARDAKFERGQNGGTIATVERPNGTEIISETDASGQLVRRYRRDGQGRETTIIDNRYHGDRRKKNRIGKNIAIGAGIGIGVVAGAAILDSLVNVPPPRVRIPRDKYIVQHEYASDDDLYEAFSAPPVDRYQDRYSLDEVRATYRLRERMRRVDLDDVTFEFGSWDVQPGQYRKLERVARAMLRVIQRNPDEVFLIEGYTDAVGTREDNLTLSDRRAESVAIILTEQFDVPFENIATQGYGEDYLKVPTLAPERANRRVAVRRITPLLARDGRVAERDGDRGGYDDRYDDRRGDGRDDDRFDGQYDGRDDGQGDRDGGQYGDDDRYRYEPYGRQDRGQ